MNKKLTVKSEHGTVISFVLTDNSPYENQILSLLGMRKGTGFRVDIHEKSVEVVDYFNASSCAEYEILSWEDTDEAAGKYNE